MVWSNRCRGKFSFSPLAEDVFRREKAEAERGLFPSYASDRYQIYISKILGFMLY